MGSPARYACCRKEMLVGSVKKWLLKNQPQEVAGFLLLVQPPLKTAPQLTVTRALQAGTTQLPLGTIPGTSHIHPTRLAKVRGWAESQVLWCNAHNIQVGAQMVKLAALQLMQSVGARSMTGGLIN
jgi:hypothetical protein